jgi:hypothetical protein
LRVITLKFEAPQIGTHLKNLRAHKLVRLKIWEFLNFFGKQKIISK